MTYSSKTNNFACSFCKQYGIGIEVHPKNDLSKIYGPYQKISTTVRGENPNATGEIETIFFHHVDDVNEGFCNCFSSKNYENPFIYHKVLCKSGYDSNSYQEKEKVSCRIIWHEVYGFSTNELNTLFNFICSNCKKQVDLNKCSTY